MGKITTQWSIIWTGDISTQCNPVEVFAHKDDLDTIYQTDQSGNRFIDQVAINATGKFVAIPELKCGSAVVVQLKGNSTTIPYAIQSGAVSRLMIPNFPLDIEISGLTSDYSTGNGDYSITSEFKNDSPTYKSKLNWKIYRDTDNFWYLVPPITNLPKLKGGNKKPADELYVVENCTGTNCQTALPIDPTDPRTPTPTPVPQPTPTPTPTPVDDGDVTLSTISSSDDKITVGWNVLNPNIVAWELQMSVGTNFISNVSKTGQVDITNFEFTNLNHSTTYYFRIRVYTQSSNPSDWVYLATNTTIPGTTANFNLFLNSEKLPVIEWSKPDVNFEYIVEIVRSPGLQSDVNIKDSAPSTYTDATAVAEGTYNYLLRFRTGKFLGSFSETKNITIDKTAPNPPVLEPNDKNTNDKRLSFKWNENEEVDHYLYKFNTSEWIRFTGTSVNINGEEGENIFRIMAVDFSENRSTESSQKINVDLTKPNQPNISTTPSAIKDTSYNFKWSSSDLDVVSFAYRLNNTTWISLDKSVNNILLDLIQGENIFEIKSIDHVGNESDISQIKVRVDSNPPKKPILKRAEKLNEITNSVSYDWSESDISDVSKWEYVFKQWEFSGTEPSANNWIELNSSVLQRQVSVKDGYNMFKLRAVDEFGNRSEIASDLVDLDSEPPQMPTLAQPTITSNENNTAYGVYTWTISDDTSSVVYRLNDGEWTEKSATLEQTHKFQLKQNLNEFEIYAKDARGNKSDINKLQTLVDTIPPKAPIITGPAGQCPTQLWKKLWDACQESKAGVQQSVKITYSIMPADKIVGGFHAPGESRQRTAKTLPLLDMDMILPNIQKAFDGWSSVISSAFPNLDVTFENIGFETTNIPSSCNVLFKQKSFEHGDIRIAFVNDFEYFEPEITDRIYDNYTEFKTGVSDIQINSSLNWAQPQSASSSSYDILLGMRYYISKALGLPADILDLGSSRLKTGNHDIHKINSADIIRFKNIYSFPTITENINGKLIEKSIKYVKVEDLTVSFRSEESVSFEWKYDFISDNSDEVVKSNGWNTYPTKNVKEGQVSLPLTSSNLVTNKIRFYIRSFDLNGNKSDHSFVDINILNSTKDANINSVKTLCEQNNNYKYTNQCFDRYGLFSCFASLNRPLEDAEFLTLKIKPTKYDYYILTKNENIVSTSLFGDMTYEVSGFLSYDAIKHTEPTENTNYDFGIISDVNNTVQYVTDNSDIKPPATADILSVAHYRESEFAPLGETRVNGQQDEYKPAAKIRWNPVDDSDFHKYQVVLTPATNNSLEVYTLDVFKIDETDMIIIMPEYNTLYKFYVKAIDKTGNASTSDAVEYKTVVKNSPPKLGEFELYYGSYEGFQVKYNERPGSKWTVEFRLPSIEDVEFTSGVNKIPDIEDASRADYNESDWLSLLGHLPIRIESKRWPGQPETNDFTGYWVSRDVVRDDSGKKVSDIKVHARGPELNTDKKYRFGVSLSGYEANQDYSFRFKIYDTTGHYASKSYTFTTRKVSGDVTAPPTPTFSADQLAYFNGNDIDGTDVSWMQSVIKFNWSIKETSDLSKFNLRYKSNQDISWTEGYLDIDQLKKVSDGNIANYSVVLGKFKPSALYEFHTESVDNSENWSHAKKITYTTSPGDKTSPNAPSIKAVHRIKSDQYGVRALFEVNTPPEPGLILRIHMTKNRNLTNIYEYEYKAFGEHESGTFVALHPTHLDPKTSYKLAFAYTDDAMNWSPTIYQFVPDDAIQIEGESGISSETILGNAEELKLNQTYLN